jgi:hypothetical protein
MKKLLFVLVVAASMTACNNSADSAAKVDSAAKAAADTIKSVVDSAAHKADSTISAAADSAKSKLGAVVDSAKKAIKK